MTVVSTANNIGSDTEFILRVRSFTDTMNNRGPRTDPWKTPRFSVPQSDKMGQSNEYMENYVTVPIFLHS
jgi:hypothetical protein